MRSQTIEEQILTADTADVADQKTALEDEVRIDLSDLSGDGSKDSSRSTRR